MKVPDNLVKAILKARSFLIVIHINPDGDALGSALALARVLKKHMGREVTLLNNDPIPQVYRFLPGWEDFSHTLPQTTPDVLILLDCGEVERTGFKNLPGKLKLVVDHHLTKQNFGDIKWGISDASSTGEMVFNLIHALGAPLDKDTALCLYTAIVTDTGGFRYSSTSPSSFRAAAELLEAGVSPWNVTENIYESISSERMALMGKALNGLKRNGEVAVISVTDSMYKETGTSAEDTENFANLARSIKGVEVAVFLRQIGPDSFKVSMRSKGRVNVAAIAEAMGGGGHHNAAGGLMKGRLNEVEKKVTTMVKDALGSRKPE